MKVKNDLAIIHFKTQPEWRQWLDHHYAQPDGIWIRLFKKYSGIQTITYAEALDEALCYGWIDGLVNKYDEDSYLQKFTPRRPRSIWSKKNTEHAARLIQLGKMHANGLAEIEKAKADGRWERAYDSPTNMQLPAEFLTELANNKKAKDFFDSLNKTNVYAIAWRLQTAKKIETKQKRIKQIIEMLEKGEKFH